MTYKVNFHKTNDFKSALYQDNLKNIILVIKFKQTDLKQLKSAIKP